VHAAPRFSRLRDIARDTAWVAEPDSGRFPGCKRRLPPFRDWPALVPGKGGIQLSAPYNRAWLGIAYYFLTWFFKAWLFVDSKANSHSAP
jgi:hypothetical protein